VIGPVSVVQSTNRSGCKSNRLLRAIALPVYAEDRIESAVQGEKVYTIVCSKRRIAPGIENQ